MDSNEAPPPYSAVDPLLKQPGSGGNPSQALQRVALRGGGVLLSDASAWGSAADTTQTSVSSSLSAAAFFAERPPPIVSDRNILEHHLTIYLRSQPKDFPRRPRCWNDRADQITKQDWDMFLRYLFPPHLGLAAASEYLPRQVRAEIQRDRKDRPQETDEQRSMRIKFVIAEWNQYFFEPRAVRIVFTDVTDTRNSPSSALCPRCYPAATRASQGWFQPSMQDPGSGRQDYNLDPTDGGQPRARRDFTPGISAYPHSVTMPPHPRSGAHPFLPDGVNHPYYAQGHVAPHAPLNWQYNQWSWYDPRLNHSVSEASGFKGGPLSWISQFINQAQKCGERITEQAQIYGDQISAHAQYYGRQVEQQAIAHSRWIENQTELGTQKIEYLCDALNGGNRWPVRGYQSDPYPGTTAHLNPNWSSQVEVPSRPQLTRQPSIISRSSESSLTSVSSISTASGLSSSDLATVRAQLLSLNDHHDRDLYDAVSDLRHELNILRESRRQAHLTGHRRDLERWKSLEEQQQKRAQRHEAKREMKATKRAFRDAFRRAKIEQKERRRIERDQRRNAQRSRRDCHDEHMLEPSVDQRFANLELESRPERETDNQRATSMAGPTVQRCRSGPVSSASSVSEISSISSSSASSGRDRKKKYTKKEKRKKKQ